MVYYVQGTEFIPIEITTTSTDGYNARFDKAMTVSIEANLLNIKGQWK